MRMLPFFKPKKGFMIAGGGFETSTGGGGGGGGFSPPQFSTTETDTGYKWIDGKTIYSRVITDTFNSGGGAYYDGFTNANVLGISGTRSQSSLTVFTGVYNSNSSLVDTVEMSEDGGVKKLHYYAGGAGNVAIIVYYTKTTE